jgi:hypothetical protein
MHQSAQYACRERRAKKDAGQPSCSLCCASSPKPVHWTHAARTLQRRRVISSKLAIRFVDHFLDYRILPGDKLYYKLIRPFGPWSMEDQISFLYGQQTYYSWFEMDGKHHVADLLCQPSTPPLHRFWSFAILMDAWMVNTFDLSLIRHYLVEANRFLFDIALDSMLLSGPMMLVLPQGILVLHKHCAYWCSVHLPEFHLLPWRVWHHYLLTHPCNGCLGGVDIRKQIDSLLLNVT